MFNVCPAHFVRIIVSDRRQERLLTKRQKPFLWYHQDSNRGHTDFQSDALPTELWHRCFCFASAKLGLFFELTKLFLLFFRFIGKKSFGKGWRSNFCQLIEEKVGVCR